MTRSRHLLAGSALLVLVVGLAAQDKSVRPGINDTFKDPIITKFVGSRARVGKSTPRKEVVAACQLKPGMAVADVGAGKGLLTRLFAAEVGPRGKVYAVDIAPKFLEHIRKTSREAGFTNIETVLCKPDSAELPERSVDLVFICDTYHHFEFPYRTMASIHKALKPGGRVVLIDFQRVEGKSREWVLNHVRRRRCSPER